MRNSLIMSVARWFGNAGQKSLNQRVHEGEEGLLRQLDAADLTRVAEPPKPSFPAKGKGQQSLAPPQDLGTPEREQRPAGVNCKGL